MAIPRLHLENLKPAPRCSIWLRCVGFLCLPSFLVVKGGSSQWTRVTGEAPLLCFLTSKSKLKVGLLHLISSDTGWPGLHANSILCPQAKDDLLRVSWLARFVVASTSGVVVEKNDNPKPTTWKPSPASVPGVDPETGRWPRTS